MAINLGDINFGLGPDTRLLDKARQSILQFGQAVNRAASSQAEGARKAEAALRKQEQALLSALQSTLNLNQAIRSTGDGGNIIKSTTATFSRLVRELADGQTTALQFQRSMEDFQASTGRASRALKDLQAAKRAEATATKEALAAQKALETQLMRDSDALFRAEMAVQRYTAGLSKLRPAQQQNYFGQANAALTTFQQQIAAAGNNMQKFQAASQTFQRSMQNIRIESDKLKQSMQGSHYDAFTNALRRASDVAILLNGPLSGVATRLTLLSSISEKVSLSMAAMAVGVSAGAYAFMKFGTSAVEASRLFDRINVAQTGLSGSSQVAAAEMDYLRAVADKTGARFETLSQQYVQLNAASKGTILQGQATREIFENIILTAQRLGSTNDELSGTLRAVQQIMSKGKVSAEELRQQLGDRFPGAVQIMAAALGKTTAELDDLMKKGQIGIGALVKFSQTAAQRFGVDTSQAVDNVTAAEGRWNNALLYTSRSLDKAVGFTEAYVTALKAGTNVLGFFEQNMAASVSTIGGLTGAAAAYIAALYAPALIGGLGRTLTAIRALTTGMMALNAASLMNPFGAGITILMRLAAAAVGAAAGYKILHSALKETAGQQEQLNQKVANYLEAYRQMKLGVTGTTKELIAQQESSAASAEATINDLTLKIAKAKEELSKPAESKLLNVSANSAKLTKDIHAWTAQIQALQAQATTAKTQVAQLKQVLGEQETSEKKGFDLPAIQPDKEKPYHQTEAERMLENLKERYQVLREQSTATDKLTQDEKALLKFNEEIANIKNTKILTANQKSLLANEGSLRLQLLLNSELSKQVSLHEQSLKVQERIDQIVAAMQSNRETSQDKYSMQLDVMGLGTKEAERLQERIQIMKDGQKQLQQLAKATPAELIDSDEYRQGVEKIRSLTQQQIADLDAYYAHLDEKNKDWTLGVDQGWANYVDTATNAAKNAEQAVSSTMSNVENSMASAFSGGKTSARDFANAVIADLARVAARAVLVNAALLALGATGYSSVGGLLRGLGFGGNSGTQVYSSPEAVGPYMTDFGGGRAGGGNTKAGTLYEVNEDGPELYSTGGRTYLMSGADGGYVTPIKNAGRSSSSGGDTFHISTQVNVDGSGNASVTTSTGGGNAGDMGKQLASQLTPTIKNQIITEMRPGGVLWKWKQGQI